MSKGNYQKRGHAKKSGIWKSLLLTTAPEFLDDQKFFKNFYEKYIKLCYYRKLSIFLISFLNSLWWLLLKSIVKHILMIFHHIGNLSLTDFFFTLVFSWKLKPHLFLKVSNHLEEDLRNKKPFAPGASPTQRPTFSW